MTIQLRDFSTFTRRSRLWNRYLPAFSAFADLGKVRDAGLDGFFPLVGGVVYLAGRNIGDEYRYVLDRRNQKKFPGNMLERPALLLNPWVVRSTETGEQMVQAGEEYRKILRQQGGQTIPPQTPAAMPWSDSSNGRHAAQFHLISRLSLRFLSHPARTLYPTKTASVKIPRKHLGPHSMICVVAVDPVNTTAKSISLPEQKADFVDLRLKTASIPKAILPSRSR